MNPFNLAFYLRHKTKFFLVFTNLRSLFNFLSIWGCRTPSGIPRNMFSVYSTTLVEGVEVSIERRENFSKKRKCRT